MDDPTFHLALERGSEPLHVTIATRIAAAIDAGRLTSGARLPPERRLAESFGVSRMTVRQALGELEREGALRRVVGRAGGTFVCEKDEVPVSRPQLAAGVAAGLRRGGGATVLEVISAEIEPAGRRTAAALDLRRADRIVVITRLRLAGGKPFSVERSSLPAHLFPDIEDMDLGGSLYDLMGEGFGHRPVTAVERLELAEARPSDVRTLGVKRGAPVILVERVGRTAAGLPVEFARDRFRADRTSFVVESVDVGE